MTPRPINYLLCFSFLVLTAACGSRTNESSEDNRIKVIFDTDANNELDDQHALAYLLFNTKTFNVLGVTVNATHSGGNIDEQFEEAKRVMILSRAFGKIPLLKGADGSFSEIREHVQSDSHDGREAVDFIVSQAKSVSNGRIILLAVGKLTNVALALEREPSIAEKVRIVWLGSNYPQPGEYNQDNDTVSMNYILNRNVPFEMVTVRYGESSGTAAVSVTRKEIQAKMPGLGPQSPEPVVGRHGGTFSTFGDYSVNLFEHIDYHDDHQSRALFDMVAVAILKDNSWGAQKEIPAPVLINNEWIERPDNSRKIVVWENFHREPILNDFFQTMNRYDLVD